MASHVVASSHNPQQPVLLGLTGSIGTQTLGVLSRLGEYVPWMATLAAGGSCLELLARQVITRGIPVLAVTGGREDFVGRLRQVLRSVATRAGRPDRVTTILTDPGAATMAVQTAELRAGDTVINGITGLVGLLSTLATLASGTRLILVNKELLVTGGTLVRQALTRPGQIVPVNSEHSAIAQALACDRHKKRPTSPVLNGRSETRRLVLTVSGGPFRGCSRAELTGISAAIALKYPTWDMGPVATISSSTLINKGLELIETHFLFDVVPERIDVVVHPQSVIHSMVELTDDAIIAQTSPPDVRLPIALGLTWPEHLDLLGPVTPNDWCEPVSWTFESLDDAAFLAVNLARSAVAASNTHLAVLSTANEQAVAAFLTGGLEWLDTVETDAAVVGEHEGLTGPGLDDVLAAETQARVRVDELIAVRNGGTCS